VRGFLLGNQWSVEAVGCAPWTWVRLSDVL